LVVYFLKGFKYITDLGLEIKSVKKKRQQPLDFNQNSIKLAKRSFKKNSKINAKFMSVVSIKNKV